MDNNWFSDSLDSVIKRLIFCLVLLRKELIMITAFRFSPGDTNLVLREFEKCGMILKHVPGPRNANWMHILYQVTPLPIGIHITESSG